MAEIWAAAAGVAISAGSAAYGMSQQKKAAKAAQAGQMGAIGAGDLGDVPEAALYQPLNFTQEQNWAIGSNLDNMDRTKQLIGQVNPFVTADALQRVKKLVPGYMSSLSQMGANANALLNGRLPFDDVSDIVSDRAEMGGGLNVPGTAGGATLKDLGLSRVDAMGKGAGLLGQMVQMAETVSPRGSYMNPRDMMISPLERIRLEMEQAQLEQQSNQNYNNLEAAGNPTEAAQAQIRLGMASAGNSAPDIAGYASAAQQLISAASKWNQNSQGPSNNLLASTPTTQFYSDFGGDWAPVAQPTGRTWSAATSSWA